MPSLNSKLTPWVRVRSGFFFILWRVFPRHRRRGIKWCKVKILCQLLRSSHIIHFSLYKRIVHVCTYYRAILHPDMTELSSQYFTEFYNIIPVLGCRQQKFLTSFDTIAQSRSILVQNFLIQLLFHGKLQIVLFSCFKAAAICVNK